MQLGLNSCVLQTRSKMLDWDEYNWCLTSVLKFDTSFLIKVAKSCIAYAPDAHSC